MKPHTPQSLAWQEGFEAALLWARGSDYGCSANPYLADQPAATETAPELADDPYDQCLVAGCIYTRGHKGKCFQPGDVVPAETAPQGAPCECCGELPGFCKMSCSYGGKGAAAPTPAREQARPACPCGLPGGSHARGCQAL